MILTQPLLIYGNNEKNGKMKTTITSKIYSSLPKIIGIILFVGLIKFFAGGGCSDYSDKKLIKLLPEPPFEKSIEGRRYWWSGEVTLDQIEAYETALKNAGFNLSISKTPFGHIRNDSITVDNYYYRAIYEKDKNIFVIFTGKGLRIDTEKKGKSSIFERAR